MEWCLSGQYGYCHGNMTYQIKSGIICQLSVRMLRSKHDLSVNNSNHNPVLNNFLLMNHIVSINTLSNRNLFKWCQMRILGKSASKRIFKTGTPKIRWGNKWGEFLIIILSLGTSRPVQFMKVNIFKPQEKEEIFQTWLQLHNNFLY